jgi:hypothetical protein
MTFHSHIRGSHEHSTGEPFAVLPFEAAGTLVMVVEDGTGWIADTHGHRVAVTAPHVAIWAPGDLVEYGTHDQWRTRDYWGPREQEKGFYPGDPEEPPE